MSATSRRTRIAYADDHTVMRRGVISILTGMAPDFEFVAEAPNGRDLLEALEKLSPLPDVCLLDVSMPTMGGYETLVELKRRYGSSVQAIMFTMFDNEMVIVSSIRAGASGFLLKDSEPEEVIRAIRHVADGEFYSSDITTGPMLACIRKNLPHHAEFSDRERQFLKLCATELSVKEIAKTLDTSQRTVEGLRKLLCERLGVKSRIGLAMYAMQAGLVGA